MPSSRISRTRMRGLSEANGSWKTICITPRRRRNARTRELRQVDRRARLDERNAPAARLDQPQDRLAGGGLAAAGLADQRQGAPLVQCEIDAVDRPHVAHRAPQDAAPDREVHLQARHPQQRRGRTRPAPASAHARGGDSGSRVPALPATAQMAARPCSAPRVGGTRPWAGACRRHSASA